MPRSVAETCVKFGKVLQSMMNGTCDDFDDKMKPQLKIMSKEIVKQRKRLGGDFAVAQAVVSRDTIQRSFCFTVDPSYKVHVCTGCGPRMARMERTTKQQPGTAGPAYLAVASFLSISSGPSFGRTLEGLFGYN